MDKYFVLKVFVAALATVGIEEFIKNFFKPKNKIWYAVLMIPLSIGCYLSVDLLPLYVIGSLLTIGSVQLCYQSFVQVFKTLVISLTNKIKNVTPTESVTNNSFAQ